ncbi:MAG: LPXTG cell wall anchor domain-containing protein, partial [Firmicutes bacterium]|nr:LPXTG cell wall anchor domain-containing protein [Bacillota bacterium]
FAVSHINAKAFPDSADLKTIYIEGEVTIDENAFQDLPETVTFETGSEATKEAIVACGIDAARVKYTPVGTKIVAVGDSIAAGYALAEYKENGWDDNTGDRYPTPSDAFLSVVEGDLKAALAEEKLPVITDNQAVSGWTSKQLRDELEQGDYDSYLEDADIVTVTIGSNDLLGTFIELVIDEVDAVFGVNNDEVIVYATFDKNRPTIHFIIKRMAEDTVEKLSMLINNLNTKLEDNAALLQGCDAFKITYQPQILAMLKEKAPDAEIYWTTIYNPFYGAKIELSTLLPGVAGDSSAVLDLSALGAFYIEEMNKAFDTNTEGYHVVDIYEAFNKAGLTNVDISRNDNGTAEDLTDDQLNLGLDPHPNTAGHKVIADLLFDALEETYLAEDLGDDNDDTNDGNDTSVSLQAKVSVTEGIKTIPEGLKTTEFNTEDKIKAELIRVANKNSKFTVNAKNTEVWDVVLMVSEDGGKTWRNAVAADIPQGGLAVTLPYPDNTNGSDYEFTVVHMLAADAGNKKAGDTEVLSATKLRSGLEVKMTSLSPVSVSWNKITNESGTVGTSTSNKSPQTGDDQTTAPYILLMLGSLLGITYLIYRRKELNK